MTPQERLNWAVLYALREGCFFPVREPTGKAFTSVKAWKRWGAMRYLHDAIANFPFDPVHLRVSAKDLAK